MGASLKATFDGQNELGNSTELHLALCPRTEWTGNGRGKVGNACKRCCDGVPTNTVSIGGTFCHPGAVVKKGVWLKCCYGRRPFGGTSALPWCIRPARSRFQPASPSASIPWTRKVAEHVCATGLCDVSSKRSFRAEGR
jgi:hypothetical protein